jgi:hypothetical protein
MVADDYRNAAERHLEVCETLENILNNYHAKEKSGISLSSRESKEKQQIFEDLYYLTGYIIECSYCSAILKCISWEEEAKELRHNNNDYKVSYRHHSLADFVFTVDKNKYAGAKPHQLSASGFLDFFKSESRLTSVRHPIPLLTETLPHDRVCFNLFDNWNAEIRYKVEVNLNYDSVSDFLLLAFEVFEGLKKNSILS